jgi:hypothetical protein
MTTKSTYRSLSAQRLSGGTVFEKKTEYVLPNKVLILFRNCHNHNPEEMVGLSSIYKNRAICSATNTELKTT